MAGWLKKYERMARSGLAVVAVVGTETFAYFTSDGGATWMQQDTPTLRDMTAVSFVEENLGWATGRDGAMITTANGGYTWTVVTTGVPERINAVDFVDDSNGWAVGLAGLILNYSVEM